MKELMIRIVNWEAKVKKGVYINLFLEVKGIKPHIIKKNKGKIYVDL